jgi:PEP-CTERM motif
MIRLVWGCVLWGLFFVSEVRAGLILTAEAPGVQTSQVPGVITEKFDEFKPGVYTTLTTPIGTYTSPGMAIVLPDLFGGAGGTGRYFAIGVQSSHTNATLMTLNGPQAYFGFWWSAADAANVIEFFSGATLLGTFNPANTLGALSSAYLGNPNPNFLHQDPGEKFAYINVFGTNGTTFDRIVFLNDVFSGFESDNHSIRATPVEPPLPGTLISGGITPAAPEPSTITLLGIGSLSLLGYNRRRRKQAAA